MSASNTLSVLASDPSISYLPAGAWNSTNYYGNLTYAFGDSQIVYTFAVPATGIAWYGSKSGSGGNAQVCFDCPLNSTSGFLVDYTDTTAGNYVPQPGIIAAWTDLSFAIHNITIANVYDPEANNGSGGYGWLYFQGFQLTGTDGSNANNGSHPTTALSASSTAPTSVPGTTVTVTKQVTITDFVTVTAAPSSSPTKSSATSTVAVCRALAYAAVLAVLGVSYASL
ncbi:hypothetical protein CALVIDRAFT_595154 [Calocera viscosa TUFC12733]|uniref:Uncharacterized protein n=1 Tax=Calocera viscosa (strain TUFC12733) TaxID=1330018 RepID=A0A167RL20_CALVF|nr:hypothetical protein CALVIDRAFT_595154 [Calocera viscosa TUFC12733]